MIPRAVKGKGKATAATPRAPLPPPRAGDGDSQEGSAAAPSFLPRAIAPRIKVTLPGPSSSRPTPSSSTSTEPRQLTRGETEQQEALMYAVEGAVSDYGLSTWYKQTLLPTWRDADDGLLHLQHIIREVDLVRALTHSQAELQAALRSRPSIYFTLSDSGFHLKRSSTTDYAVLTAKDKDDWNSCMLYIENVPPSGSSTASSLSRSLSTIFSSPIQRLTLPNFTPQSDDQQSAFQASQSPVFPVGGGTFKGFCFVMVENEQVAQQVIADWSWSRKESSVNETAEEEGMDAENDRESNDGAEENDQAEEAVKKARAAGMRVLPLSTYHSLQEEYLAYRQAILAASRTKAPLAPRPAPPEDSGSYPVGCILWIRNTHPDSKKPTLLPLFKHLMEELSEGSGKGVEYVDVEKGVDQCHVRFSSTYLANIMLSHLTSEPKLHLTPSKLVPFSSNPSSSPVASTSTSTTPAGATADTPTRPLIPQLLTGPREKLYWSKLPEAARRAAREHAKGVGMKDTAPAKAQFEEKRALEDAVRREEAADGKGERKRSLWDAPEGGERKTKRPNRG